jgi:hypothetical protein
VARDPGGPLPKPDEDPELDGELDEFYSSVASGGAHGRQPFLYRAKVAAAFWGCSVFDLLEKPEMWIELGIIYGNTHADALEEWVRVRKAMGGG